MKKLLFAFLLALVVGISAKAETVTVYYDNSQDYSYQYHGTMSDSVTEIYFYRYSSNDYRVTAIGTPNASVTIPDSVSYNGSVYPVKRFGYSSNYIGLYEGSPLNEIHLPSTITNCDGYLPSQIISLYLTSPQTISFYNYFFQSMNPGLEIVVSESLYNTYYSNFQNSSSSYIRSAASHLISERVVTNSYTITVNTPGTLLQEYFNVASQWNDVDTLIVIGSLNATDMNCFRKMSNLGKLDLQQTNITTIRGCSGLKRLQTVIFPATVTTISDSAFMNCTHLEHLVNADNITSLGNYALYNCNKLSSLSTQNIQSIGQYALYGIHISSKLTLPELTTMNAYAFSGLYVDTLDLPKLVTVPNNAFRNSSSGSYSYIQTLLIPSATSIGTYAFYYNDYITNVEMPLVGAVGQYAFYGCDNFTSLNLPVATSISSYAFYQCTSLDSVNIPNVSTINSYAFYGCTSLVSVKIPAAMYIYNAAFYNCPIDTLVLSAYISQLGGSGSNYDYDNYPPFSTGSLTHVFCYAPIPIATSAFNSVSATLHVPAFSLNAYRMHDSWSTFPVIVPIDTLCDDLIIQNSFTLSTLHGLVEKPIIRVLNGYGNLTINTDTVVNLYGFLNRFQSPGLVKYYVNYQGSDESNIDSYFCAPIMINDTVTSDYVIQWIHMKTGYWNFVSFPFDVDIDDIEVPDGTNWVIRRYSGADRANLTGNSWQNMTSGMTLNANEGYIIHCQNTNGDNTVMFRFNAKQNSNKNKLFSNNDITIPLNKYASEKVINSNWNMVGNPYPCFFNSSAIQHNGIITVWDGYDYEAISLVDDSYTLLPGEAFFVQCPNDASSMTFLASGRSLKYTTPEISYAPANFLSSDDNARKVYNLTLSIDTLSDRTRFVINPSASVEYELSCDASKFAGNSATAPDFYMVENEEHLAINERPIASGIFSLGFNAKVAGNYTITLESNPDATTRPYITDKQTGEKKCLEDSPYTFYTAVGIFDERFIITFDEVPAGMDNADSESESDFIENGDVYAMDGRFVMHFENRMELDNLSTGTYVLRNASNETEKFIRK